MINQEYFNMNLDNKLNCKFLKNLQNDNAAVSIYLMNGIKLNGTISEFDDAHIILQSSSSQLIFQHAISTIVPHKS